MTQCFTITPGIVGSRSQLSPRRCNVQALSEPYEEISTTDCNVSWPGKNSWEEVRWNVTHGGARKARNAVTLFLLSY